MSDRNIRDAFRMSYSDPLPDFVGDTPNGVGIAWVLSWLAHHPFMTVKTPSTLQVRQP